MPGSLPTSSSWRAPFVVCCCSLEWPIDRIMAPCVRVLGECTEVGLSCFLHFLSFLPPPPSLFFSFFFFSSLFPSFFNLPRGTF